MNRETALKQLKLLEKYRGNMRLAAEEWPSKFQTLTSIILSARSRDETTIKIAKILFKKYRTAKKLADANVKDIEKIIRPINFYKNKSKNAVNCAKILVEKYKSKVPEDFEKLTKLPGVGRKTANVFLAECGGSNIGVDTHVSYISQKLGWTKNKNPHKIEKDLERLFPKKYWRKLNYIMVKFGKEHTSKRKKDKILDEIKGLK